jgi:DNA-directed RNA polymerase subunit RPC12/RpoP
MRKVKKRIDIFQGKKREFMIHELTKVYGYKCWYCGKRFKYDGEICIDHIKAFSVGGKSDKENLALSCKQCNTHKFYYHVTDFLLYLAYIRSSAFECPILRQIDIPDRERDILQKSFYEN